MPGGLFFDHDAVRHRVMRKAVLLRLHADEAQAFILSGADGAAAFGQDAEPVARFDFVDFAVEIKLALAAENTVELFVFLVLMHEGHSCARGQFVDRHFAAREAEKVVKLRAGRIGNMGHLQVFRHLFLLWGLRLYSQSEAYCVSNCIDKLFAHERTIVRIRTSVKYFST